MRPFLLLLLCVFGVSSFLHAQQKEDLHPCGTPAWKSKWLHDYQQHPHDFKTADDTILYVPLTIHLLGTDNGEGYFNHKRLYDALCRLNLDFEATNIQFFIEGDIRYIDNSAWNNHETVLEGAEMMFENNVENTINCYIVGDPAGNCGYNLPYAGIALAKSCTGPNDHTWAHEMGHNLTLPHPFIGWEGGIGYNDPGTPNYNIPAPLTVLYNYTYFQDTLILDTLIIDTAYVEFVERINCYEAADGFCDTEADYLNYRWDCDNNNMSLVQQNDPDTVAFHSDGTLFMSYSTDGCQNRFTEEQIAAMRANLLDEKPELLYNQVPAEPLGGSPENLAPNDGIASAYNGTTLSWDEVANTEGYYVRLNINFNDILIFDQDWVTTETSIEIEDELMIGQNYEWYVYVYNSHHFCQAISEGSFVAEDVSSVAQIDGLQSLVVFPTVLNAANETINIHVTLDKAQEMNVTVTNVAGQVMKQETQEMLVGKNELALTSQDLAAGVYFLTISDGVGQVTRRIVKQ